MARMRKKRVSDAEALTRLVCKLTGTSVLDIVVAQDEYNKVPVIFPYSRDVDHLENAEKLLLFLWCQVPSGTTDHLIEMLTKNSKDDLDDLVNRLTKKYQYGIKKGPS